MIGKIYKGFNMATLLRPRRLKTAIMHNFIISQSTLSKPVRNLLVKCRPVLLLGSLISTMILTACQTVPMTTSVETSTDTTAPATEHVIADNTKDAAALEDKVMSYADELTPPSTQGATVPSYPAQSPPRPANPNINNHHSVQNPLTQQSSNQNTIQRLPNVLNGPSALPMPPPKAVINEPVTVQPSRNDYIISQPPALPSHSELLERSRQNSQQQNHQTIADGSDLPAFRNLMQTGTEQLKAGDLTAAENTFTRAQRLAPRSSAVYFYLSQVALKKNQPHKAEAMARRGLSVSQDPSRRRALWQLILQSGQLQNNSRVIGEAKQALK